MPASDISEVKIEFGFGVKRGEYEPIKSAKATITAIVGEGDDGVIALNYISKLARDKVGELLALQPPTEGAAPGPLATSTAQAEVDKVTATRKPRRTKEQIEADLVEAQAEQASREAAGAKSELVADEVVYTSEEADEWAVDAGDAEIDDKTLLDSASAAASRIGNAQPVKDLISTYNDLPEGQRFSITRLAQALRGDFLKKLAELK